MSESPRNPITLKPVVYTVPGADAVGVQTDIEFASADGVPMLMDLYRPPDAGGAPHPAVVIVPGYVDEGFSRMLGCRHKEMAAVVGWGKLIAASGAVAIAYANRDPAADLAALLKHLTMNATSLGIDATRIGLWACSGHGPVALSALLHDAAVDVACAALCYPYTMDLDGTTGVAEGAKTFRFANACEGRSMNELKTSVPLFIARAGRDELPGLNAALDRFVAAAIARNLPIEFVNHPEGPHAFDLLDESDMSREIIRRVLAFLRFHLGLRS